MNKSILLTSVLILAGCAIMFLGLNVGLGGIKTLGWQTSTPFITITDFNVFHVQDSHVRFIGGIWFFVGAIFFAGGFMRGMLRTTMVVLCLGIAFAGLFRLSGISSGAVFSIDVVPSLVLELVGFPLLAWWIINSNKRKL